MPSSGFEIGTPPSLCHYFDDSQRSRVSEENGKQRSSQKIRGQASRSPSPVTERLIREEIPETTVISSPKRGKIRPSSAPTNRRRKETSSKSTNDLHAMRMENLNARSPPRIVDQNPSGVPRGFDRQQPLGANTLTHDEWWLLAQKSKKKSHQKHLSKSHSQPELSQKELKERLKVSLPLTPLTSF